MPTPHPNQPLHPTAPRRGRPARLAAALAWLVVASCRLADPFETQIPMRDGKTLAADVYLPSNVGRYPTVFIFTPYGKDDWRDRPLPLRADDHYAYVIADWRGRNGSAAAADPDVPLGQDGFDAVEWIASQAWSDGHVGMWGASGLGYAIFETARLRPPHLDAAMPMVSSYRTSYEEIFPGGVLRDGYASERQILGFGTAEIYKQHPSHDAWWANLEATTEYTQDFDVPMLFVSGWFDQALDLSARDYTSLAEEGVAPARDAHRLIVGPWVHEGIDLQTAGELTFPGAAGQADADGLAFFDRWLRGLGSGPSGARVKWYEMGSNAWRGGSEWPPTTGGTRTFYFQPDRSLRETAPLVDASDTAFVYDPAAPCPTLGGSELALLGPNGPRDQTPLAARTDIVAFATDPLAAPLTIQGRPTVRLQVSSDRTDTDFMARLVDVYPDGRAVLVADAARKARFRDGYASASLMAPGTVYAVDVELPSLSIQFPAGHRIGVWVSSSNYDRFFANPNDGGTLYSASAPLLVATNRIHHDPTHLSALTLPVP